MNLNGRRGTQTKSGERKITNSLVSRTFIDEQSNERENISNHMDAILKSLKITNAFPESRSIGVTKDYRF